MSELDLLFLAPAEIMNTAGAVRDPRTGQMLCPRCGRPLRPQSRWSNCRHCGQSLDWGIWNRTITITGTQFLLRLALTLMPRGIKYLPWTEIGRLRDKCARQLQCIGCVNIASVNSQAARRFSKVLLAEKEGIRFAPRISDSAVRASEKGLSLRILSVLDQSILHEFSPADISMAGRVAHVGLGGQKGQYIGRIDGEPECIHIHAGSVKQAAEMLDEHLKNTMNYHGHSDIRFPTLQDMRDAFTEAIGPEQVYSDSYQEDTLVSFDDPLSKDDPLARFLLDGELEAELGAVLRARSEVRTGDIGQA